MSLRPITRKLPYSQAYWDETYLPFCAVTTPLEELDESIVETKDGDDVPGNKSISSIPKCLSCGAPHPTSTTHYRFGNKLLCCLCGEISSILLADQQEIREGEYLDKDQYDNYKRFSPQEKRDLKNKGTDDNDDDDNEGDEDFQFFTDATEFRMPVLPGKEPSEAIWQFPAMVCPPVWWIIVDGTVGNTTSVGASRNYWTTVGAAISKALEEIPPHVHVGLLTATGSRLASWDLTSPVPHVKQYSYFYEPTSKDESEDVTEPLDLCLVPANRHYKSNLETAIRGMVDSGISGVFQEGDGEEQKTDDESSPNALFPLGMTLEVLLEFMEQAIHPGQDGDEDEDAEDEKSNGSTKLRYAGGKILCLLGNPTLETGTPPSEDSISYMGQPDFGLGGVAGACGCEGTATTKPKKVHRKKRLNSKKKKEEKYETNEKDATDLTDSNLQEYAMPFESYDMFTTVGKRCARAALGVDVIVLVPEEDEGTGAKQTIPWYGLPLLRPLSDASGAPGPLMFGTGNISDVKEPSEDETPDAHYTEKFERLHQNILARTPWQPGMAFGVQMRLRLSPGLKLEDSDFKKSRANKFNVAQFLANGSMSGPASVIMENEEDEGDKPTGDPMDAMWIMGSCDPHTSFAHDLDYDSELLDSYEVGRLKKKVTAKPVIQTCVQFTCIETDDAQPTPNHFTVCKMRVLSVALDIAEDIESIFDGLDPEALSVILVNKSALDAYLEGWGHAQSNLEQWISSVMEAFYKSALEQEDKMEEEEHRYFESDALDRSLDQDDGSLEEMDFLLGEGHFKTRLLPLLTYSVLQSDAFRLSGNNYKPSMDARLCALTQISSMTPKALSNTLMPSLSLWSLEDDKAIVDTLPLGKEGILEVMEKLDEESVKNSVFLLESTQGLFLFTADNLEESGRIETKKSCWKENLTIGPNLRQTIDEALVGYRTPPPQWKAIEELYENNRYVDLGNLEVPFSELKPMLVEDIPTNAGENYSEWRSKIAGMIKDEIEGDEKKRGEGLLQFLRFGRK